MNIQQRLYTFIFVLVASMIVTACATASRFDVSNTNSEISPQQAVADAEKLQGVQILWGGIIISSTNLTDATQLEVLAYPLKSDQRPDMDQSPLGRFLAIQQGYLEIADYASGRLISIQGTLDGTRAGKVGESEYRYPVIGIDQQYLWKESDKPDDSRFHFGIGVMLNN